MEAQYNDNPPDPICENSTSWATSTGEDLQLECSLTDGHKQPWHYDEAAGVWFDKYSENRTADMEAVERYLEARTAPLRAELALLEESIELGAKACSGALSAPAEDGSK